MNRKRQDGVNEHTEPLYNAAHVKQTMQLFRPCNFNE